MIAAVITLLRFISGSYFVAYNLILRRLFHSSYNHAKNSHSWLAFRMETAYGNPKLVLNFHDVYDYIMWCANERQHLRG